MAMLAQLKVQVKYRNTTDRLKRLVSVNFNLRLSTALANKWSQRRVRNPTVSSAESMMYFVYISMNH